MWKIDKTYGIPVENISCPGCGRRYGHHRTSVDTITHECSSCVKGNKEVELVSAKEFIEVHFGYLPNNF
jgi:acetate kinase